MSEQADQPGENQQVAVYRRVLREVLDAGLTDCSFHQDSACDCPSHLHARQVWGKAEALLASTIDGADSGREAKP